MDFHRFNLKLWTAVVFAAGALACSAQTQPSDDSLLSRPADDGSASYSDSLQLPQDKSAGIPGFNHGPNLPLPPPSVDPNAAWQKEINNRKNWTLMTPEEIMGIQTPEQIFGLPEKDSEKNLSPEERYLNRQKSATEAAATNAMAANSLFHKDLDLFGQPDESDPFSPDYKQTDDKGLSGFSRIFGTSQGPQFGKKTGSTQFVPVANVSAKKAQLEEEAEMTRFRELIGEVPSADNSSPALITAPTAPTPSLQPLAQFDPFGHPLASKVSDPSKPTSLTTLTEFTGDYTPQKKVKKPSWEAQPPPWASPDGMTPPGTTPMRKFY
jgi:hypothetical protein